MRHLWLPLALFLPLCSCSEGEAAGNAEPGQTTPGGTKAAERSGDPDAEQWPAPGSPDFGPYTEQMPGSPVTFDMVPIPGGRFRMGSPADEAGRGMDEGPPVEVMLEPFWMGKCEVTWNEYDVWNFDDELPQSKKPDGMSRPTPAYTDMTFGMGRETHPAICMTQEAARHYCIWLSKKTGKFYRLPTEAEWEYACRAGTTSAYSFGNDPGELGDHAWFAGNSEEEYHEVGLKKPNPWGLYDMHGNVCEWTLDQYIGDYYASRHGAEPRIMPLAVPEKLYPRVVRGGSWQDSAEMLRSAARRGSSAEWKVQDPQIPKSRWYHTDAQFLGFRIVRPLREPTPEERARYEML